jgi:ketosteroid isomerase-like protein
LTGSLGLADDAVMDAADSLHVFTESMAAYERRDFARLTELYAEDVRWSSPSPGFSCNGREEVFDLFRSRIESDVEVTFDEIRALPGRVLVRGRMGPGAEPFVSIFAIEGGQITAAKDFADREAAEATFVSPPR